MNENETILIIDDELQIRRLLEITLSANGYKILQAPNGKEGLVDAATYHPSLIILDLGLPDIDGLEILKKLREWLSKPIIILSVRSSEEDIVKAFKYLRVFVAQLRKKIEDNPSKPTLLITESGIGYRFGE